MMSSMKGFARTAPSYESGYEADASLGKPAASKKRLCISGLFNIGNEAWVLISETGVNSQFCASH